MRKDKERGSFGATVLGALEQEASTLPFRHSLEIMGLPRIKHYVGRKAREHFIFLMTGGPNACSNLLVILRRTSFAW